MLAPSQFVTRICKKCKTEKNRGEFPKTMNPKTCVTCRRSKRAEIKRNQLARYKQDPAWVERRKETRRTARNRDPEKARAKEREKYRKRVDKERERYRRRRGNPKYLEYHKRYRVYYYAKNGDQIRRKSSEYKLRKKVDSLMLIYSTTGKLPQQKLALYNLFGQNRVGISLDRRSQATGANRYWRMSSRTPDPLQIILWKEKRGLFRALS